MKDEHPVLLRDFLEKELALSGRIIKKLKAHTSGICVNGVERTVRYMLQQGDELVLCFPPEKISPSLVAENVPLDVVYEDESILVVNKAAGIPTIPSQLHPRGTLANHVLHYYAVHHMPYTIHVVTRLDKDTSGLVLIAKHHYSHSLFSDLQGENAIARKYQLIIEGHLSEQMGEIELPIARKPGSIIERMVDWDGKYARTHYLVLQEYLDYSLVEATLETGRTHQIRVHFSHVGHPLLGDDLYGGNWHSIKRQALHCSYLAFRHPFTGAEMNFTAKMPSDLLALIER